MTTLPAADIRAVLDGARDLLDVEDPDALPDAILGVVSALVGCDHASHNAIDLTHGEATIHSTGPVPDPGAAQAFATHAGENPLVAYQHATGDPAPVRLSDFVTNREFRRRPIYALVYRPIGVEYQLAFGGGVEPGRVSGVALNRQHRDFSERDVEVLGLLCPLLNQITATVARSAGCPGAQDVAQLTPRQRELLARLAAGATNAQIAAELGISARTVAKHLEHVYEALGVSNRTAAAARWRAVRGAPY